MEAFQYVANLVKSAILIVLKLSLQDTQMCTFMNWTIESWSD